MCYNVGQFEVGQSKKVDALVIETPVTVKFLHDYMLTHFNLFLYYLISCTWCMLVSARQLSWELFSLFQTS